MWILNNLNNGKSLDYFIVLSNEYDVGSEGMEEYDSQEFAPTVKSCEPENKPQQSLIAQGLWVFSRHAGFSVLIIISLNEIILERPLNFK